MPRRSISRPASLALLAALFVIVAPAARTGLVAVRSQHASAGANRLDHSEAVLVSSLGTRSLVRSSIRSAQLVASVVVESPRVSPQIATGIIVAAVVLLFTPRRRRAPPRFLFV